MDNVILVGVHVNMCVSGRPFGLRQLARNGKHVVLMRDLTDSMYNPARWPFVSQVRGTELFVQHVEKPICPTVTSDQILGGKPFEFSAETAGKKRTQILLLGDSATEASFLKKFAPDEPQLDTRYDRAVKTKPQADCILIRYGLNDVRKREDFDNNFAKDFRELIARLRKDHPTEMIIPATVIPFAEDLTAHAPAAKRTSIQDFLIEKLTGAAAKKSRRSPARNRRLHWHRRQRNRMVRGVFPAPHVSPPLIAPARLRHRACVPLCRAVRRADAAGFSARDPAHPLEQLLLLPRPR
ncbi:hypothetical protein LBMAG57_38410 [Verrucomicrobiota bacterium]|nr:hypothetical protein LBMAG57_38410 [Verrucomicrobiota bacterium]